VRYRLHWSFWRRLLSPDVSRVPPELLAKPVPPAQPARRATKAIRGIKVTSVRLVPLDPPAPREQRDLLERPAPPALRFE